MERQILFILSLLFAIFGVVVISFALRTIIKKNRIELIDCFRLMYGFTYGVVDVFILFTESNGERNMYFYDYSNAGIVNLFMLLIFSIVMYILLNIFYLGMRTNRELVTVNTVEEEGFLDRKQDENINKLLMGGVIALVIGWISLYLWTKAYGSLREFIVMATKIRSGRTKVYNSFAFMKHFVRIFPLSMNAFLILFLYDKTNKGRKTLYFLLIIISFLGTFFYLLASDSRVTIVFTGIGVVLICLKYRKKEKIARYLLRAFIVVSIFLVLTHSADSFTNYNRTGEWRALDFNVQNTIREFTFIGSSQMKVISLLGTDSLRLKWMDELIISITNWLPSRVVPFEIPVNIWSYNTELIKGAGASGTLPTDFVSNALYSFGAMGIVLHPFMWAFIIARFDDWFARNDGKLYMNVIYASLAAYTLQQACYNQMSSYVINCFPIALFLLISVALERIKLGGNNNG